MYYYDDGMQAVYHCTFNTAVSVYITKACYDINVS